MMYRRKPVVIEVFQMTKEMRWENSKWPSWLKKAYKSKPSEGAIWPDDTDPTGERLVCGRPENIQKIGWDDFIIQGGKGAVYSCKPADFLLTYEPVDE